MKKVYVATSLFNAKAAKEVIARFRSHGVEITYDWTTHGKLTDPKDLAVAGIGEATGVIEADLIFMMQPARTGAHIEMGIAIGYNMTISAHLEFGRATKKPIILVEDGNSEDKTFYYVDNVHKYQDIDTAFSVALKMLEVSP